MVIAGVRSMSEHEDTRLWYVLDAVVALEGLHNGLYQLRVC